MKREEAITELSVLWERNGEPTDGKYREALDMAISALSAEGEFIKKEDVDNAVYDYSRSCDVNYGQIMEYIDSLPAYSFPDKEKGEWIRHRSKSPKVDDSRECSV